ncbi:MAG: sigma 54-interacting transcriptional regulator [Succinatimonas sp.]|jgi:two-component system nitrogen regulation response regulator GlnG|nr:sigma 54-interacting transcriptional regulator [Succinatimonas sp.]MDY5721020.1 sigma 54-interacting transcriptional regulator [Succinivibrio sp.]
MNPMIWVIDDDASIRFVFDKALDANSITHRLFETGEAALDALKHETPDVIISDIKMPGIDGLELIEKVHEIDENIPFIIMTAHSDLTAAIDAYEEGSFDYLPKPFDIEQAINVIRRAAVHRVNMLQMLNQKPKTDVPVAQETTEEAEIIGKSPAMQEVFKFIGRISKTDLPVLIHGEVGTGRGQVARALHNHGERKGQKFISLNMSSIPQEMVKFELFGDVNKDLSQSAIVKADGGTLFINEISDMPMDCQNRLLQLIQHQEYTPIGSTAPIHANVRVIASTSHDLEEKINDGTFNSDLYYRLNIININIPPLRDRNNDIPLLAKYFLAQSANDSHTEPKKLTSEVLVFLCRLPWPGNVRQLKNLCKYLTIMVTGRDIQLVDLPSEFLHANKSQAKPTPMQQGAAKENATWQELLRTWVDGKLKSGEHDILNEAVPEFERVMLEATLTFTGNHKQESAKLLGWGRNTLTRKIKELNLS